MTVPPKHANASEAGVDKAGKPIVFSTPLKRNDLVEDSVMKDAGVRSEGVAVSKRLAVLPDGWIQVTTRRRKPTQQRARRPGEQPRPKPQQHRLENQRWETKQIWVRLDWKTRPVETGGGGKRRKSQ